MQEVMRRLINEEVLKQVFSIGSRRTAPLFSQFTSHLEWIWIRATRLIPSLICCLLFGCLFGGFVFVQLLSKWSPVTWCFIGRSSPLTWKAETVVLVNKWASVCVGPCVIHVCNGHSRPFECFFRQVHNDFMNRKRFILSFFDRLLWHSHRFLNNWSFSGGEKEEKRFSDAIHDSFFSYSELILMISWYFAWYCIAHNVWKDFSVDGIDNLQ